jgi:hypothetical protein
VTRTATRSTRPCGPSRRSRTWTRSGWTRPGRGGATSVTSSGRCGGRSTPPATRASESSSRGGLGPDELRALRDVADGFGVGGYVSNADPLDFALDIVEVDGDPAAKRGKLPGEKAVYRTPDGGHEIGLADREGPDGSEALLAPLVRDGEVVREFDLDAAIDRAREDADAVGYGD